MAILVLLLVTALFAYVQGLLFGKWALARIRYSRQFQVAECYAGDEIELVEVMENHKFLPVLWLRVESTIDAALHFHTEETVDIHQGKRTQYHKSLFSLRPYRRIRRKHRILCMRRGVFRLDSVSLVAGDLFGVTEKHKNIAVKAELTVYPQVVPMEEIPLPSHGWQGDVTVRRWIVDDPFMISGVREYRSGDPMKHIHWKATAKTGVMQVFQHDYTAEQRLMVCLNVEDKETTRDVVHDEALIEKGISYAATIISDTIQRGISVGFGHNGVHIDKPDTDGRLPIGGGREHLLAILSEMAHIDLRCRLLFHDFLEADCAMTEEKRDYLLITAHLSDPLRQRIEGLKQAGHSVQVLQLAHEQGRHREVSA